MTDWTAFAERCLTAPRPDRQDRDDLTTLCRDICKALMARDDYPSVGTRANNAIVLGDVRAAIELIEQLYPGWGYQVGRPLTVRAPCGWYASIFRERRTGEKLNPLGGLYSHTGFKPTDRGYRYADDPALALMAALCRVLARYEPGESALDADGAA